VDRRKRRGDGSGYTLVLGFIVLGILAVIVGYGFGNYMIRAVMGDVADTEPSEDSSTEPAAGGTAQVEEVMVNLPVLTLYRVQVGAFSSVENAQNLALELRNRSLPAHVVGGDLHRVEAGLYATKEVAVEVAADLESRGYPVYVGKWELNSPPVVLGAGDPYYNLAQKAFAALTALMMEQGMAWDAYAKQKDGQVLVEGLERVEEDIRAVHKDLQEATPPAGWQDLHVRLLDMLSLAITNIYEVKAFANSGDASTYAQAMSYFMQLTDEYRLLYNELAGRT